MTEPYSRICLTSEQNSNSNSDDMRLINPKILSDLQQARSICKLELCVGQKTKPRSVTH